MKKIIWMLISILLIINLNLVDFKIVKAIENQYYIQVGVFTDKQNIENLKAKLLKSGYDSYTYFTGESTNVYVGKYSTEAEAEKNLQNLKVIGVNGYIKTQSTTENLQNTQNLSATVKKIENTEITKTISEDNNTKNQLVLAGQTTNKVAKNYRFTSDVTVNGLFGSHVFFFDVNKNWSIENTCYLNLVLSQSSLNDNKNSTLTVYINESPVYSIFLYNKNQYKENIKIPIPVDKVNKGFNTVKIKTYRRITDKPCTDDLNPANWIVFHEESYVHIDFTDEKDTLKINDYPYPYLKASNDMPSNCIFIIPDNAKNYLMKATVFLASNFGKRRKFENVKINIFKLSDAVSKNKTNIIYIGSKSDLPNEILETLSQKEQDLIEDSALIKEIISPYNKNYKLLMIVSDNSENLIKAAQTLCYDDMVMQMNSSTQVINSDFKVNISPQEELEYFNLEKLGYSDVLLEGLFRQQAVFGAQIPKSKVINEGAKVVVKIRYSKILNFDKSLMTVYINNIPIGSKKLLESTADNDSFEIAIPKELREADFYDVKIAFDLEIKDVYCNTKPESSAWAFISKESYLYLPFEYKRDTYFEDYTNPFIKNNSFNDVLVVMPDNPSDVHINVMANIAAFLGHEINDIGNIDVIKSSEFSDKYKDKNIIAIGDGNSSTFIQNLNKSLHIKFNSSFDKFLSNEQINILDDYSSNLGSLQLTQSPYNREKNIMVITSTKEEGLLWCEKYLTDFAFVSQLRGNALTIDEAGNINWRYFGDKAKEKIDVQKPVDENTQKVVVSSQMKNFIIITLLILIVIITSSVLLIRKYRKM